MINNTLNHSSKPRLFRKIVWRFVHQLKVIKYRSTAVCEFKMADRKLKGCVSETPCRG